MKNTGEKIAIRHQRGSRSLFDSFSYQTVESDNWVPLFTKDGEISPEITEKLKLKPEVYLVLSAAQVFYYQVELPQQQARHARQLIPGVIEEYLSSPIEHILFSSEKLRNKEQISHYSTFCMERRELNEIIDSLKSQGIFVHRIHCHQQLLDLESNQAESIQIENEHLQKSEDGQILATPIQINPSDNVEYDSEIQALNYSDLDLLSKKLPLFPDMCSSPREHKRHGWLILLIIGLIFFQPLFTYYQASLFEEKGRTIRIENEKRFKNRFPEVKRIVNIETQVRNLLRQEELQQDSIFLHLLSQYTSEVVNSPNYQLLGLKFSGSNQELHLDIRAKDITEFEQLLSRLLQQKISARLSSVNESQNGARGKLIISGL